MIYAQHLAEDHRVRAAPHRHAARAYVLATAAKAARELAALVGRRRGDGRDERLRALNGLGFHSLLRTVFCYMARDPARLRLRRARYFGFLDISQIREFQGFHSIEADQDIATLPFFYKYTR